MAADGSFVIAWNSDHNAANAYDIYARRFNAAGEPLGDEFLVNTAATVNTFTAGNQQFSNAALDSDGDFVIVWSSAGRDGDGYGVYGQRYAFPSPVQPGDTDADGDVDLDDLNAVRNHFGETGEGVLGDTTPFDGVVNLDDLNAVRNHFGATSAASRTARREIVTAAVATEHTVDLASAIGPRSAVIPAVADALFASDAYAAAPSLLRRTLAKRRWGL